MTAVHTIYATLRDVNQVLSAAAFLWLVWRTVEAWPAEWAKPHHVRHYRTLLVAVSGSLLAFTWGSFHHSQSGSASSAVSVLIFVVCVLTLLLCAWWPRPRSMAKEDLR